MATTDDVRAYYTRIDEATRLQYGTSQLELARTQELLRRYLPPAPAVICDIGGAAGVYSFWLAELGYQVHLLDLTPKHIAEAQARNAQVTRPLASLHVGDGRALPFADGSAEAVLLMGPLYHLPEREERVRALTEARRVLRPGGLLCAAAINRFASLLDGFLSNLVTDPVFVEIVKQDLVTGQHRSAADRYFTTSFFHRPEELEAELRDAGFAEVGVYAVEGFGSVIPDFEAKWAEEAFRTLVLDLLRSVETEPTLLGMSLHLLAIGWKR